MKNFCLLIFALSSTFSSLGQELEFCNSINISSEQRLQNAYGVGLQYQQNLGAQFKLGLAVHYNFKKANFDEIPYIDADPVSVITQEIRSSSKRFSIRLNLQGMLKNNEYVSISLGPEFSYNYLWGTDEIDRRVGQKSNRYLYTQKNNMVRDYGFGLISSVEVKKIIAPQLSLCFTIRPEILIGKDFFVKGEEPVFSGGLGFVEFQIGIKYRLKK